MTSEIGKYTTQALKKGSRFKKNPFTYYFFSKLFLCIKVMYYAKIIIIILFEYHHKKVQSSRKCTGIQYTPAIVNSDIKARK